MLTDVRKNELLSKVVGCNEPEWTMAISIDYWQGGAVPRGFMFAKEATTDMQPQEIDVIECHPLYSSACLTMMLPQSS